MTTKPRLDLLDDLLGAEEPVIVLRPGHGHPVDLFDQLKRFSHLLGAGLKLLIVPGPGSQAPHSPRRNELTEQRISEGMQVFVDPKRGERVVVLRISALEELGMGEINQIMHSGGRHTQILVIPQTATPNPGGVKQGKLGGRATPDIPVIVYPLTDSLLSLMLLMDATVTASASKSSLDANYGKVDCGWPLVEKLFSTEFRPYVERADIPVTAQSCAIIRNALHFGLPKVVGMCPVGDLPLRFVLHSWHGVLRL